MRNIHAHQQAQQVKESSTSSLYAASSSAAAPSPWIKADGPVTKMSQDAQVFKQQQQQQQQPTK
jgi:hypothetical protein